MIKNCYHCKKEKEFTGNFKQCDDCRAYSRFKGKSRARDRESRKMGKSKVGKKVLENRSYHADYEYNRRRTDPEFREKEMHNLENQGTREWLTQ